MKPTNPKTESPHRKRCQFQYSLRTLLVVVARTTIGMSWFRHAPSLGAEDTKKAPSDVVVAKGNEVLSRVNAETKADAQDAKGWPWSGQYYAGMDRASISNSRLPRRRESSSGGMAAWGSMT